MNLHQYDLNLLVVFDRIYKDLHLTKAGKALNMSQPAMSQALKKLRDAFSDPLFVRNGKVLVPTSRAHDIARQTKEVVKLAQQTFLDEGEFDPQKSKRLFKLAMNDYTEMVIMPRLFKRVHELAPNIKIECRHLTAGEYQKEIESGETDIILGCFLSFGANIYRQTLFTDEEIVVVRKDSPILTQELTLERYIQHEHAQFLWMEGAHEIDRELKARGLKRKLVLQVQHELVLPLVLKNNDLLVNMPLRMARVFNEFLPLEILEIPLELTSYDFGQHWHERNHNDPAHKWLRTQIFEMAQSL